MIRILNRITPIVRDVFNRQSASVNCFQAWQATPCSPGARLTTNRYASTTTSIESDNNFNLMKDAVQVNAQKQPDKQCLLFVDGTGYREEVSYNELYETCLQFATGLSYVTGSTNEEGNPKAPALALVVLPKVLPWWVANIAASWCGTTVSAGSCLLTEGDLLYRLDASGADCVVCGPAHAAGVDRAQKARGKRFDGLLKVVVGDNFAVGSDWVRYEDLLALGSSKPPLPCHNNTPDDICQLFFTSGTTGKPKMVPHTHFGFGWGQKITARTWLDLHEDDMLWNVSDTGWAKAAWSSLYTPFIAGATCFVHQMERFDGQAFLEALVAEPVSVVCAPPTAYRALVQLPLEKYNFKKLRHCVSAGEPLNPEVIDIWRKKTGVGICEGYGQSETTLVCATMPGMTIKPGSMGKPAPGYDLVIVDDSLEEVATGTDGQIAIKMGQNKPKGVFKGYHGDEARTQSVFRAGLYLTGDRGYCDNDGYFWFMSRDDDVIISSGYRIGPFEVESALLEHPSVVEAGVVGAKDDLRGHIVKAFVVLTDDAAAQMKSSERDLPKLVTELQDHVKASTAPYKYPRQIEFVSVLPKTISGKIRRVELRQQEK